MADYPGSSRPTLAQFKARHLVIACGVAIFHVASAQVVVCFHSGEGYWFLPKGRRDAGEETTRAAEREGFEESGYRNRLLPLPIHHRQPLPYHPASNVALSPYVTEPVWTEFLPMSGRVQYMLHWYIAETLPADIEARMSVGGVRPYQEPSRYPPNQPLRARVKAEPDGYLPPKHEGTAVDEEEEQYRSFLVPIEEAKELLSSTSAVMADVVRVGWEAICYRLAEEETSDDKLNETREIDTSAAHTCLSCRSPIEDA